MSAVAALLAVWLIAGVGLANGIHGQIPFWYLLGWIIPLVSLTVVVLFCVVFVTNQGESK